jgi:7-keto-8-aminopelargonate synthetase-like enzyme
MQTDLVKIAHQLIETANLLIKAAHDPNTIAQTTPAFEQVDKETYEEDKPSKRSQFASRAEKVQHIRDEMKECEQIMLNSKSTNQISTAQKRLQALRGHLTKAMNQPSVAKETRWKSQV